jgi:hypothetical protein
MSFFIISLPSLLQHRHLLITHSLVLATAHHPDHHAASFCRCVPLLLVQSVQSVVLHNLSSWPSNGNAHRQQWLMRRLYSTTTLMRKAITPMPSPNPSLPPHQIHAESAPMPQVATLWQSMLHRELLQVATSFQSHRHRHRHRELLQVATSSR